MSEPPLICVTVTAPTTAELRRRRDAAVRAGDADLVELRLDSVRDPDVREALADRICPVIVTCRPAWEGGEFSGSEDSRRALLEEALAAGADYVDVEWRASFSGDIARAEGRRVVLSMHDFDGVPSDVRELARAMRQTGAAVVKIAVKATRLSDCLPLLDLAAAMKGEGKLVLIAMGEQGIATRVLASRFGSAWTYAGAMNAIGQVSPERLREYRFHDIGEATEIYGLTGFPIAHSVSPAMHNAALGAARLDAAYLPLPAADSEDFMTFARAFGLKGASVTIPFKVSLFDRMDEVDPIARRIGAINTIREVDGRWIGGNTDANGFLQPLQERSLNVKGLRASILGAGGSARAVAMGLASSGASVRVHARVESRAEDVAALVSGSVGAWPPEPGSWDLLVNCTPIGMHPNIEATPVPASQLTGTIVYDLVYNPPITRLLGEAAAAGCRTIGGLDMLVAQAQEQFQWWTGVRPAAGVMRAAAIERLAEFTTDEHHVA